jgi:hypothetical protein
MFVVIARASRPNKQRARKLSMMDLENPGELLKVPF